MQEQWRPISTHVDLYEVSDLGRVRSLARTVEVAASSRGKQYTRHVAERVLKPCFRSGYPFVVLWQGHVKREAYVHTLVLEAFVSPRPLGAYACHRDGDPTNPALVNLRWGTPAENVADARRHGTLKTGERAASAKISDTAAAEIRRLKGHVPQKDLCRQFGLSQSQVSRIQNGSRPGNSSSQHRGM